MPTVNPITTIMKAQTEEYAKEFDNYERSAKNYQLGAQTGNSPKPNINQSNSNKTYEECYVLNYPQKETAKDLKDTILNVTDSIIVTVWFSNYQNQWGQNLFNQDVRGTLWKIICKYHPNVIYTEADMSLYQDQVAGYKALAKEMDLDLQSLYFSPTVTVLYKSIGQAFNADKGTKDLIIDIDNYIHSKESKSFGLKNPPCDIQSEVLASNYYDHYNPSKDVEKFEPKLDIYGNVIKAPTQYAVHYQPPPSARDSY